MRTAVRSLRPWDNPYLSIITAERLPSRPDAASVPGKAMYRRRIPTWEAHGPHRRRQGAAAQADPRRTWVFDGDAPIRLAGIHAVRPGLRDDRIPEHREGMALPQGADGQLHRRPRAGQGRLLRQPGRLEDQGKGERVLPGGAETDADPDPALRRPRLQGGRRRVRDARERSDGAVQVRQARRVPDPVRLEGHPVQLGRRDEVITASGCYSRRPWVRGPSCARGNPRRWGRGS